MTWRNWEHEEPVKESNKSGRQKGRKFRNTVRAGVASGIIAAAAAVAKDPKPEAVIPACPAQEVMAPISVPQIDPLPIGANLTYMGHPDSTPTPEYSAVRLGNHWRSKIDRGRRLVREGEIENYPDRFHTILGQVFAKEYLEEGPDTTNINDYVNHIAQVIRDHQNNIGWEVTGKKFKLDDRRSQLLRDIGCSIDERYLLEVSLVELFGNQGADTNLAVLDRALRTSGKNLLEKIVSKYDVATSLGQYMLTPIAVEEARNVKFSGRRPPRNVEELRGDDHHIVAYNNTIANIGRLLRRLDNNELDKLEANWYKYPDDVKMLVATAHNNPTEAYHALRRWLANDMKYSYIRSCSSDILDYAKRFRSNYWELQAGSTMSDEDVVSVEDE